MTKWGADCERFPESPWRVDHEGTKVTAPERELRRRTCNLAGSNVIFDGYIFQLQGGRLQGGVSKMWAEIVPHMARAVTMHGGEFTQCVYSQRVDLRHAKSTNCGHALTGVPQLPGTQKVFSARTTGSYIRIHTKTNRQTDTYTHTHTYRCFSARTTRVYRTCALYMRYTTTFLSAQACFLFFVILLY